MSKLFILNNQPLHVVSILCLTLKSDSLITPESVIVHQIIYNLSDP